MTGHSVFVIDDDAAVRDSLLTLLRGQGFVARGFVSGIDFFSRLPEARSACVITDIRMPDMDGAEVVRRLAAVKIAIQLEISPRTVEIFRAKVMTKMRAENLSALIRMGLNRQP